MQRYALAANHLNMAWLSSPLAKNAMQEANINALRGKHV